MIFIMLSQFKLNKSGVLSLLIISILSISPLTFSQPTIIKKTVNFGMRKVENRKINTIIIHSIFNNMGGEKYDIDLIINQLRIYHVSSHYLIGRNGTIYQLVEENNIAFHAGKSKLPNGTVGVNNCSLGIELVNSFDDSPTPEQKISLVNLVKDIEKRHQIDFILRHSDISPERKTDPWNFDWEDFIKLISKTETQLNIQK